VGEDVSLKTIKQFGREVKIPIKTSLVLTVSNYHFNVSAAKIKQDQVCAPQDCKISLKFSSDDFVSTDPKSSSQAVAKNYHFDKAGFCVSYSAFMSLLADQALKDLFWPDVLRSYKEATGVDLSKSETSNVDHYQLSQAGDSTQQFEKKSGKNSGRGVKRSKKSEEELRIGGAEVDDDDDDDDDDNGDGNGEGETVGKLLRR